MSYRVRGKIFVLDDTGELYPWESCQRLCDEFETGQEVSLDFAQNQLFNHTLERLYELKPLKEVGPVIDAGGIFAYARQTGMPIAFLTLKRG